MINAAPPVQRLAARAPANRTGMPDTLKAGIEALSGMSMDHVRVHHNSPKAAQLQAHAYAQGSDIHLAPGQAHHLPHEAWHVVQQAQGRVKPTTQLKSGVPVNDDNGLEREADMMGARAASAGHVAPEALSTPPTSRPTAVQRVKWRWSASAQNWTPVGASSSTSVAPTAQGAYDGEVQDDETYRQRTDPTVTPFLRSGEHFMGGRGAEKQLAGRAPSAEDIRVTAQHHGDLRGGSGLHEIVPTNLAPTLAQYGNPSLIGVQSGARTSTGEQTFDIGNDDIGAHTGFAPKPSGSGSTHTRGQAAAHDKLRATARKLRNTDDPDVVTNKMLRSHLKTTPTGQQVLNSDYIEDMLPNRASIGAIEPVSDTGPPPPNRLALAQHIHEGRERVKRRVRTHKRATGRGRSPSPPRRPIASDGSGGEHYPHPTLDQEVEAMPGIPQTNHFEHAAELSAWMTQPMRVGFAAPPPLVSASPITNSPIGSSGGGTISTIGPSAPQHGPTGSTTTGGSGGSPALGAPPPSTMSMSLTPSTPLTLSPPTLSPVLRHPSSFMAPTTPQNSGGQRRSRRIARRSGGPMKAKRNYRHHPYK